jgi:hypothetical protein
MTTMAMEGRSVMPRSVMEEGWTIARTSAPLIDRQAKATECIDQFKADLADVLIKFKWTRAETEKLIIDLRLSLRVVTERGSTNVEESNVFQAAVDRLRGSGGQPQAPKRAKGKVYSALVRCSERDRTPIDNRMSVIRLREAWSAWLSPRPQGN